MKKVNWTKEQKQAIEEKDANILVAAAARKWKNSSISRKNNTKNLNTKNRHRPITSCNIHKCSSI